jgi:hypothetical protein
LILVADRALATHVIAEAAGGSKRLLNEAQHSGATVVAERVASRVHRTLAVLQLARSLFSLGRWDDALAAVDEVVAETAPAYRGMVIGPPLLVAIYRGEPDRAREVIDTFDRDQAEDGAAFESDYRSLREVALAWLGGPASDGAAIIDRAQSGDFGEWPAWLPLAVDLVARLPDEGALRAAAATLRRDLVPRGTPIVAAQIARLDALLAIRCERPDEAAVQWSSAIKIAAGAGMMFDVAALQLELFEHLPEHRDAPAGIREAADTFAALRATPWRERARRSLEAFDLRTA